MTLLMLMIALSAPATESPFACNVAALTSPERHRHFDELGPALRSLRTAARELPNGYEFDFPGDAKTVAMLVEWAAQERLCCPFFDIDLQMPREGGAVTMRLSGRAGTKEFIKVDFAPWINGVR
jgi:hypothetical protein